jgi:hypothetical protein
VRAHVGDRVARHCLCLLCLALVVALPKPAASAMFWRVWCGATSRQLTPREASYDTSRECWANIEAADAAARKCVDTVNGPRGLGAVQAEVEARGFRRCADVRRDHGICSCRPERLR